MAIAKITDLPKEITDAEIEKQLRERLPLFHFSLRRSDDRTSADFEYEVLQPKLAQEKLMDGAFFFQSEFSWREIVR